jgi:hypothetical protein
MSLSIYCCCGTAAIRQRNKAYLHTVKLFVDKGKVSAYDSKQHAENVRDHLDEGIAIKIEVEAVEKGRLFVL